jgi:Protein of unknown function (DUF1236)
MKRPTKGVSVAVALFALASAGEIGIAQTAVAQGIDRGRQPGAAPAPRAAPAPAPRAAPSPAPMARPSAPAARMPAQRAPSVQRSAPQQPRAVQRTPQPRVAPQRRAVERALKPGKDSAQERRQQLKERRAQPSPQQPTAKQAPKQVEKGPARPDVAGKGKQDVGSKGKQQGAQPVSRVQATDDQRRQVRERLFKSGQVQRIPRQRLNVPLTVGSHIPRRHRLHRFTPALLALVPIYAAYSYLVVDDTICVVDPETYAIVDVIPSYTERAGPPAGSSGPRLALSPEQMRCIYETVPKNQARVDLRIRLALGAEVPRDVNLARFPERTLACAPGLASFGYVVVQDDVIIVDPNDYAIVQVISA